MDTAMDAFPRPTLSSGGYPWTVIPLAQRTR